MGFQEEIVIEASPRTVFARYADVPRWNEWDSDISSAAIAGKFKAGTKGVLTPAKGPKATFILSEVTADQSFTSKTRLPLCTMLFEHKLISANESTRAIHRVSFTGPLSPVWKRIIGTQIKRGLPDALRGLKEICESKADE